MAWNRKYVNRKDTRVIDQDQRDEINYKGKYLLSILLLNVGVILNAPNKYKDELKYYKYKGTLVVYL